MKNLKLFWIVLGVVIISVFCITILPLFSTYTSFLLAKPAIQSPTIPDIKYAEIAFCLEYKINGTYEKAEDVMICEFTGIQYDTGGKRRTWNHYYQSSPDSKHILLHQIDESHWITLSVGNPRYFLSDPSIDYVPEFPYISVYNQKTGYYLGGTSEEADLLQQVGFQVINWTCDPQIKNTYR